MALTISRITPAHAPQMNKTLSKMVNLGDERRLSNVPPLG